MGRFAAPVEYLRNLVASSEEFQGVVEFGDEAAAKAKVFPWTADDTLPEEQMPRATVGPSGDRKLKKTSTTGWTVSGGLVVVFEFVVPEDQRSSRAAGYAWFVEKIDVIVEEMAANSNKNGYLNVKEFIEFEPPDFVDQDENNGKWEMEATFIVVT